MALGLLAISLNLLQGKPSYKAPKWKWIGEKKSFCRDTN